MEMEIIQIPKDKYLKGNVAFKESEKYSDT